eukprot:TRINITY_DN1159_c0_g1_i12.p1 TRINITY_DN1159_c0_g1~~TRINITY_DN1159_c0_g1_i12.p1  ORF type:complete len:247 (-),score=48.15 TRINITY_DN1159_c0_g1_i12:2427-3167(-)
MYRTNVLGTRNVVDVSLKKNVQKLVLTSSVAAYGANDILTPESPKNGKNSWVGYCWTKYHQEEEIFSGISSGLWATILNPVGIVGKYDRYTMASWYEMIWEKRLPFFTENQGCFGSAVEMARAHINASKIGKLGQNYVLGGVIFSMTETSKMISSVFGRVDESPAEVPLWVLYIFATVSDIYGQYFASRDPDITLETVKLLEVGSYSKVDSTKAELELGYISNINLSDVLRVSVSWWMEDWVKNKQ